MEEITTIMQRKELWKTSDLSPMATQELNDKALEAKGVWLDSDYGHIVCGINSPLIPDVQLLFNKWRIDRVFVGTPSSSLFREISKDDRESDDDEGLLRAGSVYAHIYQASVDFYTRYKKKRVIDLTELGVIIRDMIDLISHDRRFALRFNDFDIIRDDYFIAHAVETTILSLVIGKTLKLVPHRLMYLGTSSFLHEIGLLHMPPELLDENKVLSEQEKSVLAKHTILGYNILKPLGLEREIMLGVLQHHERNDGTGYNDGLTADEISLFAKIIGVTCSYHAQIFERNFKKVKSGHSSLVDLLNSLNSKYDPTILKILVQELSIFPLGSGVKLSDGSIGIIMDVDPTDPRHPTARILINRGGDIADGEDTIRIGGYLSVKHVLSQQELQELKLKISGAE